MRDSVTSPNELVALPPPDRTSLSCPQLYCNRCTWIGNLVTGMKIVDKPISRLLSRDIVWHLLQLGMNESDVLWSITPWSTLELGSRKAVNFPSWIRSAGLNIFCPIAGMTKVTASAYQPLWCVTILSGAAIVVVVVAVLFADAVAAITLVDVWNKRCPPIQNVYFKIMKSLEYSSLCNFSKTSLDWPQRVRHRLLDGRLSVRKISEYFPISFQNHNYIFVIIFCSKEIALPTSISNNCPPCPGHAHRSHFRYIDETIGTNI